MCTQACDRRPSRPPTKPPVSQYRLIIYILFAGWDPYDLYYLDLCDKATPPLIFKTLLEAPAEVTTQRTDRIAISIFKSRLLGGICTIRIMFTGWNLYDLHDLYGLDIRFYDKDTAPPLTFKILIEAPAKAALGKAEDSHNLAIFRLSVHVPVC